jgi:hypothetical protein
MNLAFQALLPADFDPSSRVWIYQSNRIFSLSEALELESMLANFTESWQSHGEAVKGFATLFFGQFLLLMADETAAGVSGCSTDSSVRLVKQIEQRFGVSLFDRQTLAFIRNDKIELLPLSQLKYAFENSFLKEDTPYFNNLVQTKAQLETNWLIPLKDSWLANRLPARL